MIRICISYLWICSVTIDVTEESISDDDSDEDYEPSVNVTLR